MTNIAPQDLQSRAQRDAYLTATEELRRVLLIPENPSEADTRRLNAAIAEVAAYGPVNAAEAMLAATYVAAAYYARDAMAALGLANGDLTQQMRCRRLANAALRESRSHLRALQHAQTHRDARDADAQQGQSFIWSQHCALRLLSGGLAEPEDRAVVAPEPATEADAAPTPQADPAEARVRIAEAYAGSYTDRAALIRHLGHVPDDISFGPPEPEEVDALLSADTPLLRQIDTAWAPRIADGSLFQRTRLSRQAGR